jgi:hypothetical protein
VQCRDCNKEVFVFSCSCGSKALFDALGDPWPLHDDACFGVKVRAAAAGGLSLPDFERRLAEEAARRGTFVPPAAADVVRRVTYQETGIARILQMTPGSEARDFTGTITSVNLGVNFFRRFGLPDGPMARALLRGLTAEPYVELYLKGVISRSTGICPVVQVFVAKDLVEKVGAGHGARVSVRLTPRDVAGKERIWLGERLRIEEN